MKPEVRFVNQPKHFWANVRTISQQVGYTSTTKDGSTGEKTTRIKVPTFSEVRAALKKIGLSSAHIADENEHPTEFGKNLYAYFEHRADVLDAVAKENLMDVECAKQVFDQLHARFSPKCPIPQNKQKGDKKAPAYFTAIVNMLIEAHAEGLPCNYDPRKLTTVTSNDVPLRTLARRVDGAFTSTVNPVAVWEIKEYYYTTTFGSRVADGVYETLLDGLELKELREHEGIDVKHYLMVDAYGTWWEMGRSYLCRIVDMLHMGLVDEVLFGYEVVERLPSLVKEWVQLAEERIRIEGES